ncbi:hypothetical protein [Cryobacterium sp. BB736]|uniref:hypothetical protein n=1 Tax=Cryobacterium sp. BB736 TaxID=2746963 RepID=UPI001876431F|nr:hypothetical protein [Cryobacterium sp. BB736]
MSALSMRKTASTAKRERRTFDRVALLLATTCAGLFLLTACTVYDTHASPPSPPATPSSDQPFNAMDLAADIAWEKVLVRFPDATRPDVHYIRTPEHDAYMATIVDCLSDEGVEAALAENGGGYEFLNGYTEQVAVAEYICNVMYPIDPSLYPIATKDQIGQIHDYFVTELTPCLEQEGHEIDAPPSRQYFVDNWPHAGWNPYFSVDTSDPDRTTILEEKCPPVWPG